MQDVCLDNKNISTKIHMPKIRVPDKYNRTLTKIKNFLMQTNVYLQLRKEEFLEEM